MSGTKRQCRAPAPTIFVICAGLAFACPPVAAQSQDDSPSLRLGLSTGLQVNSNRNLEVDDPGSTTELFTRLDFLARFATPIQKLDISGDIGVRSVNGAGEAGLSGGADPSLRLAYTRQSRDARLTANAFFRERDVSSSELQFDPVSADFDLLDATGTQQQFGFDGTLELRRRAPLGVTLTTGFTGVRFSDTTDPDLTNEDRFRIGLNLRFNLNPVTQYALGAQFSTFEEEGSPDGREDTFTLNGSLTRTVRNGSIGMQFAAADTDDGTRLSLSASRVIETERVQVTGRFGLVREAVGDVVAIGGADLTYTLSNGSLTAAFDRSVISGTDDEEQVVTSANLGYETLLNARTRFDARFTFTDRDATGDGGGGRFSTVSLAVERQLNRDWALNVGLEHRVVNDDSSGRSDDSSLRISLRRDILARR